MNPEETIELIQECQNWMAAYVEAKDFIFDLVEGKKTLEDAKQYIYCLNRGFPQ